MSGLTRLANSRAASLLAGSGEVWAQTRWGQELLVQRDDFVGRTVTVFGDLDPKLSWIVRRLVGPSDVAIDIGANFGLITLLMSRCAKQVYAFEPNPQLCKYIRESLSHNGISNVTLFESALGHSEDKARLRVPPGNYGAASLSRNPDVTAVEYMVPVRTLDGSLDGVDSVAMIKMDVEGYEAKVLRGASRVLGDLRPVWLFENNGSEHETTDIFRDFDYQIISIPKCLFRMRTESGEASHDLIAVPRERMRALAPTLRIR